MSELSITLHWKRSEPELRPVVRFDDGFSVEAAKLDEMHERAHRYCFIANSLAESVQVSVGRGEAA